MCDEENGEKNAHEFSEPVIGKAPPNGRGKIYEVTELFNPPGQPAYYVAITAYREEWLFREYKPFFYCVDTEPYLRVSPILPKAQAVAAKPHSLIPGSNRIAVARMLASALSHAAHGQVDEAEAAIGRADAFLEARNQEWSRATYIFLCTLAAFLVFVAVSLMLCWPSGPAMNDAAASWNWQALPFLPYKFELLAGALGALVSVLLLDQRSTRVDPSSGWGMQFAEAFFRILAGCLGALLVKAAINAELVLSSLQDNRSFVLLACAVGGLSERLIPTIVRRVEDSFGVDRPQQEQRKNGQGAEQKNPGDGNRGAQDPAPNEDKPPTG